MKLISCRKSWSCEFGWGSQLFQVLSSSGESHSRAWMVRVQSLTPRALTVAGQPQLRIGWTGWEGDSEMLLSVPISGQPMSPLGTLGEGGSAGPPSWTPPPPLPPFKISTWLPAWERRRKREGKEKKRKLRQPRAGENALRLRFGGEGKARGRCPSLLRLPPRAAKSRLPTHPSLTTWGAKLSQAQHKDKIEMQIPSLCSE